MNMIKKRKFWSYLGRFILLHLVIYSIIGTGFLIFQNALPASERVALDFFQPYQPLSMMTILNQIIRGGVMGLILYPFYETIIRKQRGWIVIFGAMWGLGLLCSVEPVPGSIEGFIYTRTTIAEHLLVLFAGGIQQFLFSWFFFKWERRVDITRGSTQIGGDYHG